uniref:Uncharacterized protein n=1 Tax=viral metagenome TaxID=1070528 RepID=A0A6C0KPX1_9ZZZZ
MDNDIIDISTDFDELSNFSSSKSNFGNGIELLMNDKKNTNQGLSSDIDIDDLNNLENELNNLANETSPPISNVFDSGLFGIKTFNEDRPSVRFDESPINIDSNIGQSTANTDSDSKTWDGYGKFNNIPINPDQRMNSDPKLSKEELLREKFKYLRKLEALEKKGVELTKKYNMDSNLLEMQGEYEMIMDEKSRQNSVKFQGNMMMACINGIEFLNNRFDPFDVKLEGWGEQINENIGDYDEIFGELYEKYKSKASMAPELKLLFQLGGSAMMVHMTNTMFKSAMPGMDDILRQNPDLMRQFQSAAVNSMANSNPGFSGFMNGVMNPGDNKGPPPPMATQSFQPPSNRGGNNLNSRPDISMARSSFANMNDGISIKESNLGVPGFEPPQPSQKSARRPDMKGPSDISDILSGLKTKTIDIALNPPSMMQESNNNSTISIDDLKSIQSDANIPKRTRRKQKSDKNTVSLDI